MKNEIVKNIYIKDVIDFFNKNLDKNNKEI